MVLIPVIIVVVAVVAVSMVVAYLTDKSAEHHDGNNG